ncbi:phospho-N-acetylmuramoyl-pentapeptide-transferase [Clostridium botulinum]|uniref:Phospho-N-acetylmuramoyl-pentapeptide-transferase n=1 Tax=Clostridium botulinum (strain Langeland / NCTC 10281 / Type F) TaxID=441772 RepID=A7GBS3_CLOBL|nr:phospho-N-acetylmuramoyl-pentapeptide-transferase [Clostridium botulinum]ABS40618.1 phospho-N-acetylmuramoyl-pentapeptide-transferase [Clostridium botulinum F str. Langeland]KKM40020.1 phospho-N-acetylmuramoyl-pentapeptide-transferase [Clostridium botulinum]MBY6791967.1 phospho-N-acetylmuramoyl-pentapeptide-transferase [Clostridium botulinum]MBY6935976.1 phospho-N-acetylmuramoyl-pentapeptide-transferase [Clostridium botulinum]MBY6943398.1 phospho-N-acetylmuramoyl-pentapeptide-transferase [C
MSTIIYAVLFSFLLSTITSLFLIPLFKKLNLGQSIKNGIPINHKKKAGTPTFGGIIFIFSSIITMLFMIKNYNKELLLVISSLIAFGLIGFIDDTLKKIHKKNEGLTSKGKMILLLFVSSIFAIYSYYDPSIGSIIMFPFTKKLFNLRILYIPFIIFYYVSTTNALNLTDGLDGLATSTTLLVVTFFIFLSFGMGHYTLSISCGCIAGALLGFLRYNCYPAKIIMGDTGSLALGGAIATIAMILKNPFIVIIVGGIYVIEALSSLIQIVSFKLFGKRIFKMAPIHHSFELHGWHETKIVSVFSIITTILCLIGFLSM